MTWIESAWGWLIAQGHALWLLLLPASGLLAWIGKPLVNYFSEVKREERAAKAEQVKAAIEFVHFADEFRRYWERKYYDDKNAEPNPEPESFVEWSGDAFDPLLTAESRPVYARLSPALRGEAFALDQRVKNAKSAIASLYEYADHEIDTEAPIIVCEIAIAADALYDNTLREAGIKRPHSYDSIRGISVSLAKSEQDKKDAEEAAKHSEFMQMIEALPKKPTTND